jgi:integrase/recombinase XerD
MRSWRDQFLDVIRTSKSERTVEAYGDSVARFERFLDDQGYDVTDAPVDSLQRFATLQVNTISQNTGEKLSPNTIHWRMSGINRYIRWCERAGLRSQSMIPAELPAIQETMPPVLSPALLRQYMQRARGFSEPYATALQLLPMTGLRRAEMCQVKLRDISLSPKMYIHIRKTANTRIKSKRDRKVVPLKSAFPVLRDFCVKVRPVLRRNEWAFPMSKGGHISPRMLGDKVKKIREAMGISELTAHTLRHCYATELKRAGVADVFIQRLLGHSKFDTTSKYIHLDIDMLTDAVGSVDATWTQPEPE